MNINEWIATHSRRGKSGEEKIMPEDGFEPTPCIPTDHSPGSKDKVEVMRTRMERGEDLFSDEDYKEPIPIGYGTRPEKYQIRHFSGRQVLPPNRFQ